MSPNSWKNVKELARKARQLEDERAQAVRNARQAAIFIDSIVPTLTNRTDVECAKNIVKNIRDCEMRGWTVL